MRRVFAIILLILPIAACSSPKGESDGAAAWTGAAGTALALEGFSRVAEHGAYSLWADADTASFEIRREGQVWRSLPERAGDDEWVNPQLQKNVSSLVILTALDPKGAPAVIPSADGASVTCESIPGGIRFLFRFERQQITVPLELTLNDYGFSAAVAPGGVREDGDYLVNSILILPYFISGSPDDDGFLFYPDGSGAVADYKKDYNNAADVTQPVYGFDLGIGPVEVASLSQGYRMPVFGAKTNGVAYLAVIDEGASFAASVQTGVCRGNNRYFKNGALFTFRDVGKVAIRDNATTVNTNYTIPAPVTATSPLTANYLLLSGEDVRYTDMAFAYRAHLERTGVFTERRYAVNGAHLTLTGALVKPSSVLGVPMMREITLTTFKQAGEILDALHTAGVGKTAVLFQGAQKGGVNSQWTRDFKFNGALGGRKGWTNLTHRASEYTPVSDSFYLCGEFLQIYKTGRGFSASRDAARTTGNGINFQYGYNLLDGTRDTSSRRRYLLSPWLWEKTLDRFAGGRWREQDDPAGLLAVMDAGMLVYSEYTQNAPLFRDRTGLMLTGALKNVKTLTRSLALTYGNAYTWGAADTLYSVPLYASGYFIQSGEVPFYQLVTHGYIEYSGEAQNLAPDKQLSFLRSVEYGALPHYSGIYAPSSELTRSELAGIFSACYLDWLPEAADQAAQAQDLYTRISGQRMTDHRQLGEGVFETVYENGERVVVDYNTLSFTSRKGDG